MRVLVPFHDPPSAEVPLWNVVFPSVVLCWFQEDPVFELYP